MKVIDINNWDRRKYFDFYKNYNNPCFSINLNLDIDKLIELTKKQNLKFFPTFIYCLMKAMNEIEEFKYRVRNNTVVLHDLIHPTYTVLNEKNQYVFCFTKYDSNFKMFYKNVIQDIEREVKGENLEDETDKDDLVFISNIPWFSFTALMHPFSEDDPHSIPRVSFGKYFVENERIKLPISFQFHHGLCDGFHIAQLIDKINCAISELNLV